MDAELTNRSRDAINAASNRAVTEGHPDLTPAHLLLALLQGQEDPDVPWEHAMMLVEHLPGDNVALTLVKDGDHRLSRPEDIERLISAVEGMADHAAG